MTALNKQAHQTENERMAQSLAERNGEPVEGLRQRISKLEEIATDYGMKFQKAQDALKHQALLHQSQMKAAENNLIDSECHVAELEDALRDKQALIEAAEKRIAEHNFENRLLANADRDIKALRQRIAELEAREVTLPAACADDEYFIDGVFQPLRYERDVERAIRAAGIGVKGE